MIPNADLASAPSIHTRLGGMQRHTNLYLVQSLWRPIQYLLGKRYLPLSPEFQICRVGI